MSIVVIGSSNSDMVVTVPHIPVPGETVMGADFQIYKGGKGANQAVAAARSGGEVTFIANIGSDELGDAAIENFKKEHINTVYIVRDKGRSGVALIMVSNKGENSIAVSPESNALLTPAHIEACADVLRQANIILVQLEIPLETVIKIGELARKYKVKFILNPAPAQSLPEQLLKNVSIITPNETEASLLTNVEVKDIDSAKQAAQYLLTLGIEQIIITLGEKGALLATGSDFYHFPAYNIKAIDTTAAGDIFNGVLTESLIAGNDIKTAVAYANAAGALSATLPGAQNAAPSRTAIVDFMRLYKNETNKV